MIICDRNQPGRRNGCGGIRIWLGLLAAAVAGGAAERTPALTPDEALAAFQLEKGLRIELVAAEPLVVDPVALAFDEQRRLYVVEGRGYPGPIDNSPAPPVGRVALLEDRDGDGRYERRTEFAEGLTYPNGIAVWRGGVFVTCAPDILYLKDHDGDGIADEKRVVLTGFDTTRSTQLRVSHPTLGLDGKIYVTGGLNGGKVTSPEHPGRAAVMFAPADGRFDPETLVYETTGGRGQFGLTFDAFGRRFVSSNRHPAMQVVLEPWQLRRNPHFAFADTMQHVSKVEAEARVWPTSRASVSADFVPALLGKSHVDTFTSACGVLLFGGTALGEDHQANLFICEPAQNLVQRQVMRREGVSFRSAAASPGREFLSSTDVWFRPVFLAEGPDGALYVADMYRREIDHPVYVPTEARSGLDFEGGKDRGRIYRIVREDAVQPKPGRELREVADLVRGLESADAWWREQAQRLIVERDERAAAPLLERCATTAQLPASRARALWTLRGLDALTPETVGKSLGDSDPGVREQAVALAAGLMPANPGLIEPLLKAATDEDIRVRLAVALVLGSWDDARAVPLLAAIAARDGQDRWMRAAVLSGIGSRMDAFCTEFARWQPEGSPAVAAVMEDLGRLIGAGAALPVGRRFLQQTLAAGDTAVWRIPAALGLAEGVRGRADFSTKAGVAPLAALLAMEAEGNGDVAGLEIIFRRAAAVAVDEKEPSAQRRAAIALLGHTDYAHGAAGLGALLDARHPPELQLQVVRAIERSGDARGGELLVQQSHWGRYTPQIREAAIATLLTKPTLVRVLFAAIQRGGIKPPEISSLRRRQLLNHPDPELRREAAEIFQSLEGGDRLEIYRSLRGILAAPVDPASGAAVFARACSTCHTYRNVGGKVGPDLTGVRHQPADALLLHILVPNYEVAPGYQAIAVTTQDGRSLSGWLSAETESSVTLRTAFGTEETVLRKSIASLTASGVSLMPDGLEQTMSRDELAGLIAYLKSDPRTTP